MKYGARALFLFDLFSIVASFLLSFAVRVPLPYLERELPRFIELLPPLLLLRLGLFALFGLYRYIWAQHAIREIVAVVFASIFGSIIAIVALVFVSLHEPIEQFPRLVLLYEFILTTVLISAHRLSFRVLDMRTLERHEEDNLRHQRVLDEHIQTWLRQAPPDVQQMWRRSRGWSGTRVAKRLLDVTVALLAIFVVSPVLLIVSALIKLESPGPVMADIPRRAGRHGVQFKMYKFRGMVPNAHSLLVSNPELWDRYRRNNFKLLDDDPRLTRIGRFIRKTSIDELPNLLNVLHGEMSLVGPRPRYPFEILAQAERFPHTIPDLLRMLTVKPGLTGPWQVSGRSNLGYEERTRMEASYAENHTFWGDVALCLQTVPVVLKQEGAH